MSSSDMAGLKQAWTDEDIDDAITVIEYEEGEEGDKIEVVSPDDAIHLCRRIRDDIRAEADEVMAGIVRRLHEDITPTLNEVDQLRAQIATLKLANAALTEQLAAQSGQQWRPLPPGNHEYDGGSVIDAAPSDDAIDIVDAWVQEQLATNEPGSSDWANAWIVREWLRRDAVVAGEGEQWERAFPPDWDRHPWANYACLVASFSHYDKITFMWYYWECEPEWGERSYNWVAGKSGPSLFVRREPLSTFFDTRTTLRQRPAAAREEAAPAQGEEGAA